MDRKRLVYLCMVMGPFFLLGLVAIDGRSHVELFQQVEYGPIQSARLERYIAPVGAVFEHELHRTHPRGEPHDAGPVREMWLSLYRKGQLRPISPPSLVSYNDTAQEQILFARSILIAASVDEASQRPGLSDVERLNILLDTLELTEINKYGDLAGLSSAAGQGRRILEHIRVQAQKVSLEERALVAQRLEMHRTDLHALAGLFEGLRLAAVSDRRFQETTGGPGFYGRLVAACEDADGRVATDPTVLAPIHDDDVPIALRTGMAMTGEREFQRILEALIVDLRLDPMPVVVPPVESEHGFRRADPEVSALRP